MPTPLRFPGQYADPETGLNYNVHRHYDPDAGRYTSADPLGLAAGPNPRRYVHNPHELVDPLGLAPSCGSPGSAKHPDDWPVISGIVRDAAKGKGSFRLGSATASQAGHAGHAWAGQGQSNFESRYVPSGQ